MTDVLIKYDGSWADEIDLQGFLVMTREEWKTHLTLVKRFHGETEFEIYIGTNENITFTGFEDYKDSFEVKNLTDEEATILRKFFKSKMSYWDPNTKKNVKMTIAKNGVIAWRDICVEDWNDIIDSESDETIDDDMSENVIRTG